MSWSPLQSQGQLWPGCHKRPQDGQGGLRGPPPAAMGAAAHRACGSHGILGWGDWGKEQVWEMEDMKEK